MAAVFKSIADWYPAEDSKLTLPGDAIPLTVTPLAGFNVGEPVVRATSILVPMGSATLASVGTVISLPVVTTNTFPASANSRVAAEVLMVRMPTVPEYVPAAPAGPVAPVAPAGPVGPSWPRVSLVSVVRQVPPFE